MGGALAYDYEEGYIEKRERYEIIDGEVYMMSRPSIKHISVEDNITGIFKRYLRGKRCRAFSEPNVYLSEKDHYIPDVVIVCNHSIITEQYIDGAPDLVVEVLSPSTAKNDLGKKFRAYARYGVKEYWLVDPVGKNVEVYYLDDGRFEFVGFYHLYSERELKYLDEADLAEAESQRTIKVSLYEDFTVEVSDIFEDVD